MLQEWHSLAQVQLCLRTHWSRPSLLDWFPGLRLTLLHYGPAWWSLCCILPWLPSLDLILTCKSSLTSLTLDLFNHHKLIWSSVILCDLCCYSQACLGLEGWGTGWWGPCPACCVTMPDCPSLGEQLAALTHLQLPKALILHSIFVKTQLSMKIFAFRSATKIRFIAARYIILQ